MVVSTISSLIVTTDNTKNIISQTSISIGILLSSSSGFYRMFGWISLYSNKFLQLYSPLLYKIMSVLILLLPFKNPLESIFESGELGTVEGDENISTSTGTLKQYSNFVDDRIVRTTVDDKKRLKRYCSESYLNQMREYIADIEIKDKISKNNIKNNNNKLKVKVVHKKRKSKKSKH